MKIKQFSTVHIETPKASLTALIMARMNEKGQVEVYSNRKWIPVKTKVMKMYHETREAEFINE